VTGVEEKRRRRARHRRSELSDPRAHARAIEIVPLDYPETEVAQRGRNVVRVILRVREFRRETILAIADHQRDARAGRLRGRSS
jgi:hypothetical protein